MTMARGRSARIRPASAVAIAAVALLFVAVGLPAGVAILDQFGSNGPWFIVIFPAIVLSLSLVGGFIALRVPANPVGWLLEIAGLAASVGIFGGTYAMFDHASGAGLPLVVPIAWLSSWTVLPAIGMLVIYVPLLFPTGRFLSPRWRVFGLMAIVGALASLLGSAFAPGPLSSAGWIDNPLGIAGATDALGAVTTLSNLVTPFFFGGAIVSVFVRYRRAGRVERLQLKWFGLVAGVAVVAFAISIPNNGPISDAAWIVGLVTLAALPVAIGIAILRYRLWDIDRIVSRTVGYAAVTGILGATFAALVIALDTLLAPLAGGNGLAVAASTLAVAALFSPLRRRVQRAVDRRFDRSRYDAERTVAALAARLRDETDLERLGREIEAATHRALAPTQVTLWTRER
jgi:hypothetical protein